jgi:hypothetical protein
MNIINWIQENRKDLIFFGALVVAIFAISRLGESPIEDIVTTWRWIMVVLVGFVIVASWLVTNNPLFGWLINQQNSMSLSRLQMFLWTFVVLSAFTTAVFANLHFKHADAALDIAIPEELWLAMGISIASLAGSALVQENKRGKKPKPDEPIGNNTGREGNVQNGNSGEPVVQLAGILVIKEKPSLLDLISGEEIGNQGRIDLSRLQNLFFTFILVGMYMGSLGTMFRNAVTVVKAGAKIADNFPITEFPALSTSFVTLLAISHAGYLTIKAIDKQPSKPV